MRDSISIVSAVNPTSTTINGIAYINLGDGYQIPAVNLGVKATQVQIAAAAGAAGTAVLTFATAPSVGDEFKVTLISQARSTQVYRKTFTHTVPDAASATVTAVAAAFAAAISADIANGASDVFATAANVAGVLTITQAGDDKKALQCEVYTTSATTTIGKAVTQTTYSEGQPSDLLDAGIPQSKITLGSYDTSKLKYTPKVAVPFIDMEGTIVKEIIWFGPAGTGNAALNALLP